MTSRTLLVGALLVALAAGVSRAEEINPVVGKAGEFTLREADLDRFIDALPAEAQQQLRKNPEQRSLLAREILQTRAIAMKARKDGFDRKPEVRERLGYFVDDFLAREYLTKVVIAGVKVSDAELRAYYQEHAKDFVMPEQAIVRHIFIGFTDAADSQAKAAAKTKTEGVLERLKKGEDFAAVAAEASEDIESAKEGGLLGAITPGQTNSEEFEKAVFALKAGEMSGLVESPFGYHIVKVDERKEKRALPFDEVKDALRSKLQGEAEQKKLREFVDEVAKQTGLELPASEEKPSGEGK
ncbi:peptidylprolyl isomerase [Geobacter sulfurreducens]|uniref:Peptidylprolyl cis-trans isomerase, PpiC-type n=1 Tax=Geobacter sulfurreducens (strain ATCC 51573 / DSM 12127 / PCA) TaxID=243231 RepID=Q74G86_GEOSL|nr:peptidylprolyl isomerase [Geobacter sulfurreducens]AAR33693.1 peptidylprolyl cis-trans isomerase, PpiC-type [Geobacter sulfurreducens PCA]ADI83192.2 peptidylprolyl cis-trans isomerase, PpiC-type [Geobacter sulfurreducens KN400]AJY70086.1 peptidylprolyl isomerase [Geobacter sulfurreducens]QVW35620.1 peptidylprolyl isomerase [Geobacter sulfurreducens]UAC04444.1 peptidylprolyl isomerase [Geobacter sulfurreducens]